MAAFSKFHVVMFPWFAFGHLIPFLHLSNKLADRGHKVSFLLPNKALADLKKQSRHDDDLITFYPLKLPAVDGLPPGAETASDIPFSFQTHLATAFDATRNQVEALITDLAPDFVLHDFSHWLPEFSSSLGIKCISFIVISAITTSQAFTPFTRVSSHPAFTEAGLCQTPPGYPSPEVALRKYEAPKKFESDFEFGKGITFHDRVYSVMERSDAICFRTCNEIEGKFVDYFQSLWKKPVFLTGLALPEKGEEGSILDPKWADWLDRFDPGSVVFCTFGSQSNVEKAQFQELLLGFESTGSPFLVSFLNPPVGSLSVQEALPDGFEERVKGRGLVYDGWVQQTSILNHKSVGCFVSHCGFGSMWEALMSDCQVVLLPQLPDQILNTRLMVKEMKVAVEVERLENGLVSKERLCEAIKSVMDEESEVGSIVRINHSKYRKMLLKEGLMNGYIDKFIEELRKLKTVKQGAETGESTV